MSGSAKAGTTAERHTCELRAPKQIVVRAPHKRASGEICFLLTKTGSKIAFLMPDSLEVRLGIQGF